MDNERSAQALMSLVEEHHEMLYRYAYRLSGSAVDADDLTQQTYLVAQNKLDQLRDKTKAGGWLCAILRNLFLKERRELQKLTLVPLDETATSEEKEEPKDDWEVTPELLQESLNELPEEFRTPIILFYFENLSYRQIAEAMEIPLGTVMSRLARGKGQLRSQLKLRQQPLVENETTD